LHGCAQYDNEHDSERFMPVIPKNAVGAKIIGWGTALPEKVVTNDDLSKTMDTSDEWIRERTGIERRHIGGSTASLSIESGRKAIEMAGIDPLSIDALVLSTTTPDRTVPATSAAVQHGLGLRCGAFDVNAACSGFVYALITGHGLVAMGMRRILVIGTDTLSRITDWTDRNTAILFADGSGAAVIEATTGSGQLLGWDFDADGSLEELLYAEIGGTLHMEGKEVFRRAVRIMVDSAEKSIKAAGLTTNEISLVVPHQANVRIIEAACKRLDISMDKAAIVLHETGNTSSASIPLALFDAVDNSRVKTGDNILLVGFGAGMTAASAVIKWNQS
jgi:3-oxoacyl-[acyl-carrier-protein] synthase-3